MRPSVDGYAKLLASPAFFCYIKGEVIHQT
jgi:hypothetical protein